MAWDPFWRALVVGWLLAAAGCLSAREASQSGEAGQSGEADQSREAGQDHELCAWGVDALLEQVNVSAPERSNCGHYRRATFAPLTAPFECFESARSSGLAVQLTVEDHSGLPRTYIATNADRIFLAVHEDPNLGRFDGQRLTRIARCSALVLEEDGELRCEGEEQLYSCSEPGSIEREPLTEPPVLPLKLADLPISQDKEGRVLHLRINNQSPDHPLVSISVFLDGVHLVEGDFDFERWDHNEFDLNVPVGRHRFRAESHGEPSVQYEQVFEHTSESWATLAYDYQKGRWHDEDDSFASSIPALFTLLLDDFCSFESCPRQ